MMIFKYEEIMREYTKKYQKKNGITRKSAVIEMATRRLRGGETLRLNRRLTGGKCPRSLK